MRKGRFITSAVLAALTFVLLCGIVAYVIYLKNTTFEGWDGLGEAILFVLYLIFAAVAVAICAPVGFFTAKSALKSESARIRRGALVFAIYHGVAFLADAALGIYALVNKLVS